MPTRQSVSLSVVTRFRLTKLVSSSSRTKRSNDAGLSRVGLVVSVPLSFVSAGIAPYLEVVMCSCDCLSVTLVLGKLHVRYLFGMLI